VPIYELNGKRPRVHKTARVLDGAVIAGDVIIGPDALISWNAIVYAEEARLEIGRGACIGDGSLIHVKKESRRIGDYSTIGHGAQICDANVGDRAQVGINAVVIEGSFVAGNSMLAADSFLHDRRSTTSGMLWVGRPAEELGPMKTKDVEERAHERLTVFGTMQIVGLEQTRFE
jgi:carbonic anhydrase/acetyltransferase-like protein (isoleucine patch superfamily)